MFPHVCILIPSEVWYNPNEFQIHASCHFWSLDLWRIFPKTFEFRNCKRFFQGKETKLNGVSAVFRKSKSQVERQALDHSFVRLSFRASVWRAQPVLKRSGL